MAGHVCYFYSPLSAFAGQSVRWARLMGRWGVSLRYWTCWCHLLACSLHEKGHGGGKMRGGLMGWKMHLEKKNLAFSSNPGSKSLGSQLSSKFCWASFLSGDLASLFPFSTIWGIPGVSTFSQRAIKSPSGHWEGEQPKIHWRPVWYHTLDSLIYMFSLSNLHHILWDGDCSPHFTVQETKVQRNLWDSQSLGF